MLCTYYRYDFHFYDLFVECVRSQKKKLPHLFRGYVLHCDVKLFVFLGVLWKGFIYMYMLMDSVDLNGFKIK